MTSSSATADGSTTTISGASHNNNKLALQSQQQLTVDTKEVRHLKALSASQPPPPPKRSPSVTASMSADELRKRVEILDEKNAMTDFVIRQLSEQIARLQQQQQQQPNSVGPHPPLQPPSSVQSIPTVSALNSPVGGSPVKTKATTASRQAQQVRVVWSF